MTISLKLKPIILSLALSCSGTAAFGCTNLIVGKQASTDGSTILSYAADSFTRYGELCHQARGEHPEGDMRQIIRWGSFTRLGEIPEAAQTYNVVGNMNEHQLCLGESTWGGHAELEDKSGNSILDYGSLMYIALQRCKTAREAINLIDHLAQEYGYASSGESISLIDKDEAWIMEIIGKGDEKGAVWVAVRIPDNAIAAHANEPRIRKVDFSDTDNVLHSADVIDFARRKGYFKGKDEDFSFADAFCNHNPGLRRSCDARVWSFFNKFNPEMEKYLDWVLSNNDEPMPLYIVPQRKISVEDIQWCMRDHYEDTPLDLRYDLASGPYHAPYRWRPLRYEYEGETYSHERPISTAQTGWSFVAQTRDWLPDPIGGLFWFGTDDANMTVYMPLYCSMTQVPKELQMIVGQQDMQNFSMDSNFWMNNWVANQVYHRYEVMIEDVRKVQSSLENEFHSSRATTEENLLKMYNSGEIQTMETTMNIEGEYLAKKATDSYRDLAQFLIVRYMDGVKKNLDDNGQFVTSPEGYATAPSSPGYGESFTRRMVEQDGDKYRLRK